MWLQRPIYEVVFKAPVTSFIAQLLSDGCHLWFGLTGVIKMIGNWLAGTPGDAIKMFLDLIINSETSLSNASYPNLLHTTVNITLCESFM